MAYYLGIDLGTSGLKAVLLAPDGTISGIGYRGYEIEIPRPGFAQQQPETWWRAMCGAISEVLQKTGITAQDVGGIGFSGQMHGTVLLDAACEVLYPAVIWCDQRSIAQSRLIWDTLGTEKLGAWVQNPVSPGFQICTLLWMREQEPEIFARTRHVLLPKDYLRYRLTGALGTDVTDASSTLLFDCASGRWSQEMLSAFSLDAALFPDADHMPWEVAGELTAKAALETGLRAGIPVVYGGGDQPMQAVGNGIISPGDASLTVGSGGQILSPTATPRYDSQLRTHTFCHADRGLWYVMGATLGACLSLNWFLSRVLGCEDIRQTDAMAAQVAPGSGGLVFLPYLNGERTPHLDPQARGVFFGMTLSHGRGDMIRAVLEGIAFSLLDAMQVLIQMQLPIRRLIISGGGAASSLWRQIFADVFQRPIFSTCMREEAGVGAALCAMVGAGQYRTLGEACEAIVRYEAEPVMPQSENHAAYQDAYHLFRDVYQASAPLFQAYYGS